MCATQSDNQTTSPVTTLTFTNPIQAKSPVGAKKNLAVEVKQIHFVVNGSDFQNMYRKPAVNWLPEEDQELTRLVHEYDFKNWTEIAYEMSRLFSAKQ